MTKIKNIATLIFRIIGALLLFDGAMVALVYLIELITKLFGKTTSIEAPSSDAIGMLIFGWCLLRYSKNLAVLFCKGLDEDTK